jgi:uncharacterized alpha/beta hydrolase family protein
MKKIIVLIVVLLALFSFFAYPETQNTEQKSKETSQPQDIITKTYILKHVSPGVVQQTLSQYLRGASYDNNGNMFTAKISRENIIKFESLLRQLDVEKKKILIRIFTIIASQENKGNDIRTAELKQVLNELQRVLSFNSYRMDGASAITVMEGQRRSELKLDRKSVV